MINLTSKWFIVKKEYTYSVPPLCYQTKKEALNNFANLNSEDYAIVNLTDLNVLIEKNNYRLFY
jgi:hypothetical protein